MSQRSIPNTDLKTAWFSRPTYSAPRGFRVFMVFASVRSNASAMLMMSSKRHRNIVPVVCLDDCPADTRGTVTSRIEPSNVFPRGDVLLLFERKRGARLGCPVTIVSSTCARTNSFVPHKDSTVWKQSCKKHAQQRLHHMCLPESWSASQTILNAFFIIKHAISPADNSRWHFKKHSVPQVDELRSGKLSRVQERW